MIDRFVCGELLAERIEVAFVGMQARFVRNVSANDLQDFVYVRSGTWNERTFPPRSTKVTIARLCPGPVSYR